MNALGRPPRTVGMLPAQADVAAPETCQKKPGAQGTSRWSWQASGVLHGRGPCGGRTRLGHRLGWPMAVCQRALGAATVACRGGLACHHARGRHGPAPHRHHRGDGWGVLAPGGGCPPGHPPHEHLGQGARSTVRPRASHRSHVGDCVARLAYRFPHVKRMERVWPLVNKPCRSSTDSADRQSFPQAIFQGSDRAPPPHKDAWDSLLPGRVHTFQAVSVMGEPPTGSSALQEKVLSKAA